jgi:hypothetical protein
MPFVSLIQFYADSKGLCGEISRSGFGVAKIAFAIHFLIVESVSHFSFALVMFVVSDSGAHNAAHREQHTVGSDSDG